MNKKYEYLDEASILRRAEQERSKAVGEFFSRLFSRHKAANVPLNPIPAE